MLPESRQQPQSRYSLPAGMLHARAIQRYKAANAPCYDQTMLKSSGAAATLSLNAGHSRYACGLREGLPNTLQFPRWDAACSCNSTISGSKCSVL